MGTVTWNVSYASIGSSSAEHQKATKQQKRRPPAEDQDVGQPVVNEDARFVLVTGTEASPNGGVGVGLHVRVPGLTVTRAQAVQIREKLVEALALDPRLQKTVKSWNEVIDLQVYGSSREDKQTGSLRIF